MTVQLFPNATCAGAPSATTTTVAGPAGFGNGYYQFPNLLAGPYCVQFSGIPAGWSISPANAGGNDVVDSDVNPATGRITNINLTANDPNEDMGIYVPGSLGDNVQCVSTGQGLANITVNLFKDFDANGVPDGPVFRTTQTNASGFYQFTGLEVALAGGANTTRYIVRVDTADPDLGTCNVSIPPTSYNPPLTSTNPNDPTNDFRFQEPARFTLGDRVWYDQNQNGIQDPNEPGYNGVTVQLFPNATCAGAPSATTTTVAGPAGFGNGYYQFPNLLAGPYCVQFSGIPAGWSISPANVGGNDVVDSNVDPATGRITNINLTANDPNEDMGIYVPGSLGDNVQCVSTGQGLANITVNLFKDFDANGVPDGPVFRTTQTNASGFYQFTGLEVALAGGANTTRYIVRVDTADPDLGTCNVSIPPTSYNPPLTSTNPNDPTNDFRFQEPARFTLGDRVWYDQNQNGIQDPNEPGYNGVTVQLFPNATCAGAPSATTTTVAGPAGFGNGYYQFPNLLAGPYCVQFSGIPAGWSISPANVGGNDVVDSDVDPATGRITNINLTANDPNEDMGIYVPGSLGDNVQCVSTGQGLANITVNLFKDFDANGVPDGPVFRTTQTNASGFYQFTGLEVALAGGANTTRYIVRVDTADPDLGTCNVSIPPTSYNPPLTSTNPNDPTNDFKFEKPLVCGLVIDKKCAVTPTPSSQWVCSDAKPINSLSMIWNGTQPVKIKAWKGAVNSTLLASVDNVVPGQKVTVTGFAGSPNNVIWEIFAAGTSTKLGNSTFHLSCSDADMTGPEDCGKAQGDGKGQTGFINTWKLEGMAGNGQSFLCTPTPPAPADNCTFAPSPAPSCDTLNKPTSLTFKYTGGGCGASTNPQGGKATCSGSINPNLPAAVSTSNSGYSINPTTVSPNGEFTVSASSFSSNSFFTLRNGSTAEQLKIHTSCSQVLQVGNVFGSLTLVAFSGQRGGSEVTYFYEVSNQGDPLTGVTVTDDPLGPIGGPITLPAGGTQTFQKVTRITQTTTNTGTVLGTLANGQVCTDSDTATVTVEVPDRCDLSSTNLVFGGKEVKTKITNSGVDDLVISRISITWPQANGFLDEIKRGGDTIHKGNFSWTSAVPTAVIDSGWEGNLDKREIKAGDAKELKFKFQNNVTSQGAYKIVVEFDLGCVVEITYTPGGSGQTFTCSKPINQLSMIWNGGQPVNVIAYKGAVGSTVLGTFPNVANGQTVTVPGYAGSPNDVIWEIFAAGGSKIGESTFHVSCSDVDMNGADDCGKPEGDGKAKSGYLNTWLFKGMVDSNETLTCP